LDAITCFYYFFSFVSYTNDVDINISDITEKGNPTTPRLRGARVGKIFIPTLVILVGIGGFGLGKLTKIQETRLPIKIITPVVGTMSPPKIGGDAEGRGDMTNSVTSTTTPRRVYVAARGGTVYYLPSCAGANRISEKNKIWFETKAEAERLGYRPAQNCKGL
jgi:hypothetical protein